MKKLLLTMVTVVAVGLAAAPAWAEGAKQSFNATNILASGDVLLNYPTNATAGKVTGSGISLVNYDRSGLYFSGHVTVAGTATVTVVRSPLTAPSSWSDYESTSLMTLTIPMPATGPFMWVTNLEPWYVRPVNYAGLNLLTNAAGTITNFDIGLTKKLLPPGTR